MHSIFFVNEVIAEVQHKHVFYSLGRTDSKARGKYKAFKDIFLQR